MKNITKEQIDDVVMKAGLKVSKDISDILAENVKKFSNLAKQSNDSFLENYSLYLGLMTTVSQTSLEILKESLYELLCNE